LRRLQSQLEQAWSQSDGNLLEFSEAHGLTPAYGCRSGQCGSCKVKLLKGSVTYPNNISASIDSDEVLLCSAMPAATADDAIAQLKIQL
jgi:ferredoxin